MSTKTLERTLARKAKDHARLTLKRIEKAAIDAETYSAEIELAKALHPSNWKG